MSERRRNENRIRQRSTAACDACRARKVKCAMPSDGSRCSICSNLDIECTSIQPRKRRGPKNRYVQTLRIELDGGDPIEENDITERPSLDLIAPDTVLQNITSDWFERIHPVAPIFHPTTFLRRIADSQSTGDCSASFLLLVASVCAATIASLPRRSHLYEGVTVERCISLAERFKLWTPSTDITLEKTLALYNLCSALHHESGMDAPFVHRLMAEAACNLRYMLHYKLDSMPFLDQQVLKRVYWLAYAGQCTFDIHGRPLIVLRQPHDHVNALLPLEISDEELLSGPDSSVSHEDYPQTCSYVSGLNALSRLFLVWQSSQAITIQSMENLQQHIEQAQQVLANLPPELTWHNEGATTQTQTPSEFAFNVQKVNLKITQLHIRSNLLEQMNTIAKDEQLRFTPDAIIHERRQVVDELLDTLYRVPKEIFDANGYSVVPKIRDIGSALLDELRTGSHGRTSQASISLDKLLAKLEELDMRHVPLTPS
ncbi:hypothetical protein DM02DRAFT_597132 [Periconia macrospinosa]|uniref:Zn(2)-C6 fungal-type domain-containing protein n=1 Tax=Periconia macrospinosa TaxID=97972 RepID=A0A2V1DI45_9PLEO|nr:hypothetical protein DM02DRAFT_597132 [Periconia macrospinosa]